MEGRINPSEIRCHHAARLIAFHAKQGNRIYYIRPFPDLDSGIFCSWNTDVAGVFLPHCREFVEELLAQWPSDRLDTFFPFPFLQLLKHHTEDERRRIYAHLVNYYGWWRGT